MEQGSIRPHLGALCRIATQPYLGVLPAPPFQNSLHLLYCLCFFLFAAVDTNNRSITFAMSDPRKYTVGWICAVQTESVAAGACLDEEHPGPTHIAQHDNNNYILGSIGHHNVVIAALPDGEYGTGSAAAVARDMLHSFPNVRIGLMVGIGGGAPTLENDVRLGDVVVSSGAGGPYGGIVQYDVDKMIEDGEPAYLNNPPWALRTAVSALKGIYERKGHELAKSAEESLKKIKRREKYIRPPPESDRLYRSHVVHPFDSAEPCTVVCGHEEAKLVVRKMRDEHDDPKVHYGLIASGNKLIKDANFRDNLANSKGVLCFEMEASGLVNHFPCLIIRGICDYSDSHKNKEWQGFAAMVAAAYARDLLLRIPPNEVEAERRLADVASSVDQSLQVVQHNTNETQHSIATITGDIRVQTAERWLGPVDTSTNYNQAREKSHRITEQ
ncbi:nucleoside phosphorylase domain-containing protein [Cladorrhinum sp. PSN259]|nr:nucleoside phosphorylase domain-containing protein [Cladorrhinum sp. PSN259]